MNTQQDNITDRRLFLKVKLISLADEARTIRRMEKRGGFLRGELRGHRIGVVREEARHTLIAYGFLRGRTPQQVGIGRRPVDWKKVGAMVSKYGPFRDTEAILAAPKRLQRWKESLTEALS